MLNNYNHDKLFLKTKFTGLKREKSQNDDFKQRHTSKTGHDMKSSLSKCLSADHDQFQP